VGWTSVSLGRLLLARKSRGGLHQSGPGPNQVGHSTCRGLKWSVPVARQFHRKVAIETPVALGIRAVSLPLVPALPADVAVAAVELVFTVVVNEPHRAPSVPVVTETPHRGDPALALYAAEHLLKAHVLVETTLFARDGSPRPGAAVEQVGESSEVHPGVERERLRRAEGEVVKRDPARPEDAPRVAATLGGLLVLVLVLGRDDADARGGARPAGEDARAGPCAARPVALAPVRDVVAVVIPEALALNGAVPSGRVALALCIFRPSVRELDVLQSWGAGNSLESVAKRACAHWWRMRIGRNIDLWSIAPPCQALSMIQLCAQLLAVGRQPLHPVELH
jgi:hypothetical protein